MAVMKFKFKFNFDFIKFNWSNIVNISASVMIFIIIPLIGFIIFTQSCMLFLFSINIFEKYLSEF